MRDYVTVGLAVLAGAALLEAAIIPGLAIGGVAVLAPKVVPTLRRRLQPLFSPTARPRPAGKPSARQPAAASAVVPARLGIKRAVAKTVTFRVIVTALDFSANYLVIGELATAASLSAFSLVAGPLFYLAHETAWNYYGPSGDVAKIPIRLPFESNSEGGGRSLTISRALAKTVTFRTIASAVEFTVTYIVVGDLLTAAGLSAFGLILGPFVYYGHEWLWDRYDPLDESVAKQAEQPKLLPAPVGA